ELYVARVFFVWLSVFNLFVVSIFWSVMADHFKSEQGRRLFGFIAAGGSAGALLGPAIVAMLVVKFGVVVLTVLSALLLELAVQCFRWLQNASSTSDAEHSSHTLTHSPISPIPDSALGGGILSGIWLILHDRYLLGIVLYMLMHTFTSTFLYFEQGRIVAA